MAKVRVFWQAEIDKLKAELLEARAQIAAEIEERHKIVAALKVRGLELHPIPDGEGRWHYEVRAAPAQEADDVCTSCDGTGVDLYDGNPERSCQVCHGSGKQPAPARETE